jgi:hypothetical protein
LLSRAKAASPDLSNSRLWAHNPHSASPAVLAVD